MKPSEVITSKREQNKAEVRQRLLTVGLELFSTVGFEKTTVSDIVEKAEIGRGTFYNYFDDVHDIFNAVMEVINKEIQKRTTAARDEANSLYELLYNPFKSFLDYVTEGRLLDFHRMNHNYVRTSAYTSDVIRQIIRDIKESLDQNSIHSEFKDDYENRLLSYVIVGAPTELFLNLISTNEVIDNDRMASFLAKLFTKVLFVEKE